jgi:hypothetical protein
MSVDISPKPLSVGVDSTLSVTRRYLNANDNVTAVFDRRYLYVDASSTLGNDYLSTVMFRNVANIITIQQSIGTTLEIQSTWGYSTVLSLSIAACNQTGLDLQVESRTDGTYFNGELDLLTGTAWQSSDYAYNVNVNASQSMTKSALSVPLALASPVASYPPEQFLPMAFTCMLV